MHHPTGTVGAPGPHPGDGGTRWRGPGVRGDNAPVDVLVPPELTERFDARIAERFMSGGDLGGVPGWLGARIVRYEPGRVWCTARVTPEMLTPFGNAHGGFVAALVDHVTGVVVYPLMEPGQWAATTEVKINYLAPVPAGPVEAQASVLAMTRRTAVVRGEVFAADRLVAAAQGTLTIVDPRR